MTELNPIIEAVATHYGFEIKWCDILNHWTIKHESHSCGFFWRSDINNPTATFFDDLKTYFEEIGAENYANY